MPSISPNSPRAFLVVEGERELRGDGEPLRGCDTLEGKSRRVDRVPSDPARWLRSRTMGTYVWGIRLTRYGPSCRAKGLGVQSWRTIQLLKKTRKSRRSQSLRRGEAVGGESRSTRLPIGPVRPAGAGCVAAGPGSDCGRITCRAYRSDPMMPLGFSGETGCRSSSQESEKPGLK